MRTGEIWDTSSKFVIDKPIYTVKPHFTGMVPRYVFSSSCRPLDRAFHKIVKNRFQKTLLRTKKGHGQKLKTLGHISFGLLRPRNHT